MTDDDVVPARMTVEEARALTDEIRHDAAQLWDKVARAYIRRAWDVLGYKSWDAYTDAEFPSMRLRLPREERRHVVCSLRSAGLSRNAIASATGADRKTVSSDLKAGGGNSPTSITGTDGKTYPPKPRPKPPEPEPPEPVEDETLDDVVRRIVSQNGGEGLVTREELRDLLEHDDMFFAITTFCMRMTQLREDALALINAFDNAIDTCGGTFYFRGYWDLPGALADVEPSLNDISRATRYIREYASLEKEARQAATSKEST